MPARWDAARQRLWVAARARQRELDTRPDEPDGPDMWLFAVGFTIGAVITGLIVYALLRGWFQ